MATRFGKFQSLAQRLITKNGRLVTYRKKGTTPINPSEPWLGNEGDTDTTNVPAVFIDYSNQERVDSIVQDGDKKCLIAALDLGNIKPSTQDKLIDGTTTWEIVNIKTLQPGNVAETVMFEIQARA